MNRTLLSRREGWDIVQCADCAMVFLGQEMSYEEQQQDHDWLGDYYREGDRRKEEQPFMVFLSRLTRPFKGNTNDRLLAQVQKWRREGKLVDFACGNGNFLARAQKYFDVTGIEMSPRSAALARELVPAERILVGAVTGVAATAVEERSFDVVTQFGYIEHEWNPREALQAAFRVLKPGGITILKTPNFDSWNRHIRGEKWCGYHIPAHCNYFTPTTLRRMLSETGFESLPQSFTDRLPTSDSFWMVAKRP